MYCKTDPQDLHRCSQSINPIFRIFPKTNCNSNPNKCFPFLHCKNSPSLIVDSLLSTGTCWNMEFVKNLKYLSRGCGISIKSFKASIFYKWSTLITHNEFIDIILWYWSKIWYHILISNCPDSFSLFLFIC